MATAEAAEAARNASREPKAVGALGVALCSERCKVSMAPGKRNRVLTGTTRAAGRPALSCVLEDGVRLPLHDVYTPCGSNAGRETRMKCSVPH
eukprot:5420728-Prymnesium_polylepis.1